MTTTMLTEATQASTVLEAINVMLKSIGESPAVSLLEGGGGSVDVESAHGTLVDVSRNIQAQGWHFNKEIALKILPEVSTGFLRLPANTLRVDEVRYNAWRYRRDLVQRGLRLYDRKNQTFEFQDVGHVEVDLVAMLPFEDLPQYARSCITITAARKFSQDELSSDTVSKFTKADEDAAYAELVRLDNLHEDPSAALHSPFFQKMLRR